MTDQERIEELENAIREVVKAFTFGHRETHEALQKAADLVDKNIRVWP